MTNFFAPTFGTDFELTTDFDALEALAEERKALWDRVNQAKFLTVDEKREAVGYDAYKPNENEEDIGARIYAPVNEQPLGSQPVDQNPEQV
jgi:phage portal protein BeeE